MAPGRDLLREQFSQYRALEMPRTGGSIDLEGAEIDLYEEDGYVAGLVDQFLEAGSLSVSVIELDQTIDSRLEAALTRSPGAAHRIAAFKRRRKAMMELAATLSRLAGVPVRPSEHR